MKSKDETARDEESPTSTPDDDAEETTSSADQDDDAAAPTTTKKGAAAAAQDDDSDDSDGDADEDDDSDEDAKDEEEAAARPAPRESRPAKKDAAPKQPAKAGAKGGPEAEGSSLPLIIVAGIIAAATVGGVYWWNNRPRTDESATLPGARTNAQQQDPSADPAQADDPDNPFAALGDLAPQRPQPIPAPEDVAAPPANATRTESGLASRVLEAGTGTAHPAATDRVTVHYTGWTTDGQMFDSSRTRGEPATFPLDGVIRGWTEGVQLMVVGEKRRFWIPEALAYQGRPGAPQGMLVFDVELISFETPPPPPPVPDDVAAVPANAERSETGLAWRVLQAGTGTEHPTDMSLVQVNLTGWTTDGEMFDSTTQRGEPLTVPVGMLSLQGLREGIKLMVQGEKRRFWVPQELAFNGRPGAPPGMLVFDIELVGMRTLPAGMGLPGMPPGAGGPPGGDPHGGDPHGH